MMKAHLLYICSILVLAIGYVQAQPLSSSQLSLVTYQQADSLLICKLLQQAPKKASPLWFARQFVKCPYVAHTLEVNDKEQLVVNTRQLDCTTFVETVLALIVCNHNSRFSWADYIDVLRLLRYRGGKLNQYPSRLHYFSDWIDDKINMGFVIEIKNPDPPFSATQMLEINFMSQHVQSYKALKANPHFIPLIRQQEKALSGRSYKYMPKSAVKHKSLLRQVIKDGDIIAITCNKTGLDIAHLGFAVWKKDGVHLLNASQLHKEVVTEPMTLYKYLQKHPTFTGVRVIRLKE